MKFLSKAKKEIVCALVNNGCRSSIEFRSEFEAFLCESHLMWRLERAGAVMNNENLKNNSDYDSLESEDTKLRQSINTLARKESTLLDVGAAGFNIASIVTALIFCNCTSRIKTKSIT